MTIFALPGRGVLRVRGEEAEAFLQNLVSNDVSVADHAHAAYATLLTPQGKFLHDFFVYRENESASEFLLETRADRLPDLKKRLTMYRLRAKIDLDDVSTEFRSIAGLGAEPPTSGLWRPDPRHADMGWRGLAAADMAVNAVSDTSAYDAHRIRLGIPEGVSDIEPEKNFLLEFRLDDLNAIDFTKGCYVGQELTARTKYRGNVKRRHFIATCDGNAPHPGTPILNADGVEVGTIRSSCGNTALALVRLDQWEKPLDAGTGPVTLSPPAFAVTA